MMLAHRTREGTLFPFQLGDLRLRNCVFLPLYRSMISVLQDIRFALRGLARRPTFAFISLLTLTLGIGANTAIFSVVRGVILRPLPYEEPDGLIRIQGLDTGTGEAVNLS